MKKIISIILSTLTFFILTSTVVAYYPLTTPNNIYGIGVINHSDLEDASNLVNTNGGNWGYVKVVITEKDRNKDVWQKFMNDCRNLHLIPIVRIATSFEGGSWKIPKLEDIDSWVIFLNSLNWVTENRYIIVSNEPNHAKEWGGVINPSEYALYLKTFSEKLHKSNSDYFVLNAGFDQAAPNGKSTMDEKKYISLMHKEIPNIFDFIDGWNSHSYPNPGFSGLKTDIGRKSIRGYEWEIEIVKKDLPIFITETGWLRKNIAHELKTAINLKYAFEEIWMKDKRIVAVTPFILNYQNDPFYEFSWKNKDGSYFPIYNEIQSTQKIKGEPKQKISGEIIFNFLNPLMAKGSEQRGVFIVKNTGQATWYQSESHVINDLDNEITVSNTKFNQIEPFSNGWVVYTLKSSDTSSVYDTKLGFYVRGERIGDIFSGKIISY